MEELFCRVDETRKVSVDDWKPKQRDSTFVNITHNKKIHPLMFLILKKRILIMLIFVVIPV